MLADEVEALALEAIECGNLLWCNVAAPHVAQFHVRVPDADVDLLDPGTGCLKRRHCLVGHGGHAAVDGEDAIVARIGDGLALQRGAHRRHEIDAALDGKGIGRIITRQRIHRQRAVLDGAGDRAFENERRGEAESIGPRRKSNAPKRRFIANDAAPRCRNADRAAAIGSLAQRQEASSNRACPAARRAAGVLRQVKGILRRSKHVIVAGATETEHRAVGLADEDGTGLFHALDEHASRLGDIVLQAPDAAEGGDPARLEIETVLHRHRHTMQRSQQIAAHHGGFGLLRLGAGFIEMRDDQRVDFGIVLFDAGDGGIHHRDRRYLLAADSRGERCGGFGLCQIFFCRHVFPPGSDF